MTALAFAVSLLSLQLAPPPILRIRVDSSRHQVVLTVTPIDLSAGHGAEPHASIHAGGELPLLRFLWPVDGWARGASLRLSAEGGTALPRAILHHINLINFGRRQLFYPIAERLLAMGPETEDIRLPATVGVPVAIGMPMGLVAAFHNPGHEPVNSITLELRIDYAPANQVPRPISVFPAYLDVQNPVAHDIDFDLPAGASIWTADFTIPISGRIIGAGGHLHDYGIVPGGGVALLRAQSCLDRVKASGDEKIGVEIIRRAIEEPIRAIVANAGVEGSIVVAKVREAKDKAYGYNAATDEYVDMVKAGIIDPTKVTRTALQNAASIAGLLLTTECVIVERKEEKGAPAGGGGGGGMGGMY